MTIKIIETNGSNPPGRVAEAELHFPQLTDEQRANLQTIDAITYAPTQAGALAVQQAARMALALDGLKLIGFAVWERRAGTGLNVTFPARQYSVNGERRSYALLRPTADLYAQDRIRNLIIDAYRQHTAPEQQPEPEPEPAPLATAGGLF